MPEGDTVWRAAQQLHAALAGRALTRADLRVPALATRDLTGRTVTEVVSRGKHLLTRIDDDLTLHSHLRMDGAWRVFAAGRPWAGGPAWQIRAILLNEQVAAVGYRLPVLELLARRDEHRAVGHLGPDLIADDCDLDEATRRLLAEPDRPIGLALLDQRVAAGIGNLYRCDVLFLQGLSPWLPTGRVPDPGALLTAARSLLRANRVRAQQSTTGSLRPGERTYVYGRAGRSCRRCGGRVAQGEQGEPPQARVVFWCPTCQAGPGRSGSVQVADR